MVAALFELLDSLLAHGQAAPDHIAERFDLCFREGESTNRFVQVLEASSDGGALSRVCVKLPASGATMTEQILTLELGEDLRVEEDEVLSRFGPGELSIQPSSRPARIVFGYVCGRARLSFTFEDVAPRRLIEVTLAQEVNS